MYYQHEGMTSSSNIAVKHNIAVGSQCAAYSIPLSPCTSTSISILNNTALSSNIGVILQAHKYYKCSSHMNSKIFACEIGLELISSDMNDKIDLSQLIMSDNHIHLRLSFSKTSYSNDYIIRNSYFHNQYFSNCPACYSVV